MILKFCLFNNMERRVRLRASGCLFIICLLCSSVIYGQEADLQSSVSLEKRDYALLELFSLVEAQTILHFSYDPRAIDTTLIISFYESPISLENILRRLRELKIQSQLKSNVIILRPLYKHSDGVTLSGLVKDSQSGELLAGANVIALGSAFAVSTNAYGFYSLTLPYRNSQNLSTQFVGYKPQQFHCNFSSDSTANISLGSTEILLNSVTVEDSLLSSEHHVNVNGGVVTITGEEIKKTPSFAGEPDALKAVQMLPGVQSGNEGTTNFSVRGGSFDQNLFLLDEAPVYNPSHALSFFSVFNPDALRSLSLYKSNIPVNYGGRLSSVVDIRMKEGNSRERKITGAIGTIASRLTAEGPFVRNNPNASFLVSARYGYAGHVMNGLYFIGSQIFNDATANISTTDNKINFYDLNGKVNYRKNERNHFYLSAYSGHDSFYLNHLTSGYSLNWGNRTGTFRWNHIHSSRLFSNTTAVFSHYKYQYNILDNTQYFRWNAQFDEAQIKQDYDFYPVLNHHLIFGWSLQRHWISPGKISPRSAQAVSSNYALDKQNAFGAAAFISNTQSLSKNISLTYGLRYSNFAKLGPGMHYLFVEGSDSPIDSVYYGSGHVEKLYHRVDPRISISYQNRLHKFSISYDRTSQFLHLLTNSSVGLPTDVWMPSSRSIRPQSANIYVADYNYTAPSKFNLNASLFYKHLSNIIDFKDNANLFVNRYVESQVLQGAGRSYGFELLAQKKFKRIASTISYTLSKSTHRIIGINDGNDFPSRYDKRHNLSLNATANISKRLEASFNFVYTTGGAITVPVGNFSFNNVSFNYYSTRNGFRLPAYHRMDISLRWQSKKNVNRKFQKFWSLDVYNVYGRKNPFTLYAQQQDYEFGLQTQIKAIYLFRIVPTLSYNFKF